MRSRCVLHGLLILLASIVTLAPAADAQSPKRGGALRVSYAALQRAAMVRHVHRCGRLRLLR